MTDELVIEARKGGPCAELGDRCRAIEAASGCFCAAVADRIEALTAQLAEDADARALMDDRLEQLVAEVDALTAERDSLLAGHRTLNIDGARLEDRAKAAEAERDRLRKALVFYADPETYQDIFVTEDCECCHRRENPAIEDDNGEVARAVLKGESHE